MITIFAEPITKEYYSNFFTFSSLIYFFFIIFCVVFPFLASFASEKFWVREDISYEQPNVSFNNELIMNFQIDNKTYFYSTNSEMYNFYPRKLLSPSISFTSIDNNFDGKYEKIKIQIIIPSDNFSGKTVQSFKIAFFLDYGIDVSKSNFFLFFIIREN